MLTNQHPVPATARQPVHATRAPLGRGRTGPVPEAIATRRVVGVEAHARATTVTARLDALLAAGGKPLVLLFCDPASTMDPATRDRATFIDLTGMPGPAANNVHVFSSPAYLEMALVRALQAIRAGSDHVIVDDAAMVHFYCGEGPTQAFTHSLAAGLMLADIGCEMFVTDSPDHAALRRGLQLRLG